MGAAKGRLRGGLRSTRSREEADEWAEGFFTRLDRLGYAHADGQSVLQRVVGDDEVIAFLGIESEDYFTQLMTDVPGAVSARRSGCVTARCECGAPVTVDDCDECGMSNRRAALAHWEPWSLATSPGDSEAASAIRRYAYAAWRHSFDRHRAFETTERTFMSWRAFPTRRRTA